MLVIIIQIQPDKELIMEIQKDYLFTKLGEQMIKIDVLVEQLRVSQQKIKELENKIQEMSKEE
jgi:cob(I)alamin adenosyltransferase